MKKTLIEDLNSKLPEVERWYIRKPVTIFISILLIIIIIPISILDGFVSFWNEFFKPCWKGVDYEDLYNDNKFPSRRS